MNNKFETKGIDEIKKRLAKKSMLVSNFMRSEAGRAIIEILDEEFHDGELRGTDTHQTYYKLGQRDVVSYLKQLAKWQD